MRAVSDTGPLIHLSWLDHLSLLNQLFEAITVPPAVRDELLAPPYGTPGLDKLHTAFERGEILVSSWIDRSMVSGTAKPELDAGEAEAIPLALTLGADIFLTDDSAARAEGVRLGMKVLGTVGLLVLAREQGLISAAYPLVVRLRERGQWLSDAIVEAVREDESEGQP